MNKSLKSTDTQTTPFIATKDWQLSNVANNDVALMEHSGNPVALEFVDYDPIKASLNTTCNLALENQSLDKINLRIGQKSSGLFFPDIEPINLDGTYTRMVYNQIKNTFYNNYRDPTKIWGMEKIDFDKSRTKKFISDRIKVLNIPQVVFGEKILENTIIIHDQTSDNEYDIKDDGLNNLFAGPNIFSKQQEIGRFVNIFNLGTDSTCDNYFSFSVPNPPINLVVVSGSAILTWNDNSNNEDGFVIERSINSGSVYTILQYLSSNVTRSVDDMVVFGGTYWYRVYAFNSFGNSDFSNTASISFNVTSSPSAPTNLSASQIDTALTVSITWNDNSTNEDGFVVDRSTNSGSTYLGFITASANVTGTFDTTVVTGSTYFYRVYAFNTFGNSAYSNTASVSVVGITSSIDPLSFGTPYLWLRSDRGLTLVSNSLVRWDSVSALTASYATSSGGVSRAPLIISNSWGPGVNGVHFNGSTNADNTGAYLELVNTDPAFSATGANINYTTIIVFRVPSGSRTPDFAPVFGSHLIGNGDNTFDFVFNMYIGGGAPANILEESGNESFVFSSSFSQSKVAGMVGSKSGSISTTFYENGYTRGGAGGSSPGNLPRYLCVGAFDGYMSASLAEVIIYSGSALSASSMRSLFDNYFKPRYQNAPGGLYG